MIAANELRKGNIFKDPYDGEDQYSIVWGFDEERIWYGNQYSCKFAEATPILLTDIIFQKTNLINENNGLYCSPEHIKQLSNKDLGTKYLSFWFNTRLNRWMEVQTRVCIDYLHELQNLYLIMCKEELVINL